MPESFGSLAAGLTTVDVRWERVLPAAAMRSLDAGREVVVTVKLKRAIVPEAVRVSGNAVIIESWSWDG